MNIEIEIKSENAKNEIYDLRNFLQEHGIEDVNLSLKEQPPKAGEMSLTIIGVLLATPVGSALLGLAIDRVFSHAIESPLTKWLEKRKNDRKPDIDVITSIKDENNKYHYITNSIGETITLDHLNFKFDVDNTKALLIGNSAFDNDFPEIQPIKNNLKDLYDILIDKKIIGIPSENVIIVFNKTNTEIQEQLLLTSNQKKLETLIIYYAGHGHRTDISKLYLIAKDTKKIGDHILNGIDFDFIKDPILKQSNAKQKIVILDACHSGIAAQSANIMLDDFNVQGTYILTSSSADQVSYFDKNKKNTFFTAEFLNTLKSGLTKNKEYFALDDIYENLSTSLKNRNYPLPQQKSELNIPLSKFYFARNPKFSFSELKDKTIVLFEQGKYEEALNEFKRLIEKYPDDVDLKKKAEKCKNEYFFQSIVNEADEAFYAERKYDKAIGKYKQALIIKEDISISNKIEKCRSELDSRSFTKNSEIKEDRNSTLDTSREKASKFDLQTNKQNDYVKRIKRYGLVSMLSLLFAIAFITFRIAYYGELFFIGFTILSLFFGLLTLSNLIVLEKVKKIE